MVKYHSASVSVFCLSRCVCVVFFTGWPQNSSLLRRWRLGAQFVAGRSAFFSVLKWFPKWPHFCVASWTTARTENSVARSSSAPVSPKPKPSELAHVLPLLWRPSSVLGTKWESPPGVLLPPSSLSLGHPAYFLSMREATTSVLQCRQKSLNSLTSVMGWLF